MWLLFYTMFCCNNYCYFYKTTVYIGHVWYNLLFFFFTLKITVEPTKEDLKCFNDYETEMKCSLSSERLQNCSGHKLNITHPVSNTWVFVQACSSSITKYTAVHLAISWHKYLLNCRFEKYTCIFERNHHSDNCECNITVEGFVATEIFNTTLLEGSNVLLYKTFMTSDFSEYKCCL